MRQRSGRSNVLRRIEELEARLTDGSGLPPNSPQWLEFWQEQFHLFETGQKHVPLTMEGVSAVMQAAPDSE